MKDIKITERDERTFIANMEYLLDNVGISAGGGEWDLTTLGGKLSNIRFDCDHGFYSVTSQFKNTPPEGSTPSWLVTENGKCNWLIKEAGDLYGGWLRPFEEISKDLALLVTGEGDVTKAIAATGILEDFIPLKGNVILQDSSMQEQQKMTAARFRKKYAAALGNKGWVSFSGTVHLEDAPYSPFAKGQMIFVYPQ